MFKYLKFANFISLLAFVVLAILNTYNKARGNEPERILMYSMNIAAGLTIVLFIIILAIIIITAIKDAKSHPHP